MINIKLNYQYLIEIFETVKQCANKWLLNSAISIREQYMKSY